LHTEGELYVAECPEAGTVSQGKTVEEAVANLQKPLSCTWKNSLLWITAGRSSLCSRPDLAGRLVKTFASYQGIASAMP
jgi:hypothetical protein